MQLTPAEIRQHTFNSGFKGYDKDEVNHFVETTASCVEELLIEKQSLFSQVAELKNNLERYEKLEKTMQDMLLHSQKSSEDIKLHAEREAMLLIKDAEIKAANLTHDAELELDELKRSITILRDQKKIFLVKFRTLIKSQIEMLTMLESGEPSGPRRPREEPRPATDTTPGL